MSAVYDAYLKDEAHEKPIIGNERHKGNIIHRVTDIGLQK